MAPQEIDFDWYTRKEKLLHAYRPPYWVSLQYLLSQMAGWLLQQQYPTWFIKFVQRQLIAFYRINMNEAEKPLHQYPSVQALFVRKLAPQSRSWDASPHTVQSPCDGVWGDWGTISPNTSFRIKNTSYPLANLLGSPSLAHLFQSGSYASFYLAPKDYHRVHYPISGKMLACCRIPGSLWPVSPLFQQLSPRSWLHNERIVTLIEPKEGFLCAVVQIGAFLVGSIVHHRLPAPSTHMDGQVLHCSPPPACFAGEELGYFAFGSSVVVLLSAQATLKFPKNRGQMLRCGEPIAIFEEI